MVNGEVDGHHAGQVAVAAAPLDDFAHLRELIDPDDATLLDVLWNESVEPMQLMASAVTSLARNRAAQAAFGDRQALAEQARVVVRDRDGVELPESQWPANLALAGQRVRRQILYVDLDNGHPVRQLLVSAHPVRLRDGRRVALVIWHDITDSWQPAAQTNAELTRLRQLLEGATDYALILMDVNGRIRTWSPAAERLYGYPESEILSRHYATFFEEEEQAAGLPADVLRQANGAGRAVIEGKRVRGDGSRFWAHCVITASRGQDGVLIGYVMVAHDVSDRHATERAVVQLNQQLRDLNEQLEQRVAERTRQLEQQTAQLTAANAELEAFSYSVSHDLRAPLRSMAGFTTLLEEDFAADLPDQAQHYLRMVNESAVQMGSLIDALLAFSRMQRQSMTSGRVDMTAIARRCWEALAPAREGRDVEFVLGELPPATGDPRLLQQVWSNLLDNALKYTSGRTDARIEVSARVEDDGSVRYLVSDNGAGFDERFAEKLGQVFQRLHRAEDFPGNGVGLALVQRIVLRHGGTLTATGRVGEGATFAFTVQGAG
ncbi:ATP-binding protein [Spongisporangium articulatum]|uniref:Sensor-like histidine kinase SenX3 n=1 Tax=Spongisporangium articulatum TaxID=3362603 RepID=A0ABW8AQI0_9ACTN